MRAIHVTAYGGPEVLQEVELERPEPMAGEIRIDVEAIGVNYADIKRRSGASRNAQSPPYVPGIEAAGTIDAVGDGVEFAVGDRVTATVSEGAYATSLVTDTKGVYPIPDSLSFEAAAGVPVQFITAYNCLHGWGGLEAGERVLIHAAAGGVGSAAVQLAARAGAEVFATASTEAKRQLASDLGADHTIDYTSVDVAEAIDAATDGAGVDLVLDGVGGEAFDSSVDALAPFGRIVTIGSASGEEGAPDPSLLRRKNASVIGYHLGWTRELDPSRIEPAPSTVLELLAAGEVELHVSETFSLSDAAAAHEFVESRESTGKVLLRP